MMMMSQKLVNRFCNIEVTFSFIYLDTGSILHIYIFSLSAKKYHFFLLELCKKNHIEVNNSCFLSNLIHIIIHQHRFVSLVSQPQFF